MKLKLTFVALALLVAFSSFAQTLQDTITKKKYFTQRIEGAAPTIDGLIDEAAWDQVEWSGGYSQLEPDNLVPPSMDTYIKILYDASNIYVAFKCLDSEPDKIENRMSRRDGFPGDWVEINLDSNGDKLTAFSFTTSVSGVKGDEFISLDGNSWDTNWSPIWYTKTSRNSEGWMAETKIPLSQLRYSNEEVQVWGIQSTRRFFRNEERSTWQPVDRNASGWVSFFGELHGIEGIKPQKQIEIQPYGVAQLSTYEADPDNPFRTKGRARNASVGLDGKIGLTSDLVLDFTINPDFGQVEADPAALRLDGFQNFFSERRPFFIEGANIFEYNVSNSEVGGDYDSDLLFYSRRIGASPHGQGDFRPWDNVYSEQPENTTILGAAKFSGKTKNGLSIGVLESVTQIEKAQINDNGELSEQIVEPLSNYFVGRVQQDLREGNTTIGGIVTAVNRQLDGTNLTNSLHSAAYSGGLDFSHRWDSQRWRLTGRMVFSDVNGTKEAITNTQQSFEHYFQRPDANHLSVDTTLTSLGGSGGNLAIGRYGGKWRFQVGATYRSPGLDLNDVGFMNTADEINQYFWLGYVQFTPVWIFRSFRWNLNERARWDFSGQHLYQVLNTNTWMQFKNQWNLNLGYNKELKDISNKALFGGPQLNRPTGSFGFVNISTPEKYKLQASINYSAGRALESLQANNIGFGLFWQPVSQASIGVNPSWRFFKRKLQSFGYETSNGEDRYLAASINQQTFSTTVRLNVNITPDLTLQYYGQPFITTVDYFDYKYVDQPDGIEDERFTQYTDSQISQDADGNFIVDENVDGISEYGFSDPDFTFTQWRSNFVARWEYIPGSELFLVWSQSNGNFGGMASENIYTSLNDELFRKQGTNIFLVKWTYRFLL